jgi:hypothetical protein
MPPSVDPGFGSSRRRVEYLIPRYCANFTPLIPLRSYSSNSDSRRSRDTSTSAVAVLITGIDAKGFNQDQKMVIEGSDFTIVHNDLAPGEVVNFKLALRDGTKQVKFVKVLPSWWSP